MEQDSDVSASDYERLERLFSLGAQRQREAIASRAHQTFLERGATHGFDLQDWLEAERVLLGRR